MGHHCELQGNLKSRSQQWCYFGSVRRDDFSQCSGASVVDPSGALRLDVAAESMGAVTIAACEAFRAAQAMVEAWTTAASCDVVCLELAVD